MGSAIGPLQRHIIAMVGPLQWSKHHYSGRRGPELRAFLTFKIQIIMQQGFVIKNIVETFFVNLQGKPMGWLKKGNIPPSSQTEFLKKYKVGARNGALALSW
ncbi:hypothetical protein HAX54_002049 [Datura stramonium]|uniref:Uncharacterized protein n=1 Tax=Datura stramonium TaxID=4076 RepID=A0ABS8RUH3_DATST|nr:hypothetical protein [Datura stramonium]